MVTATPEVLTWTRTEQAKYGVIEEGGFAAHFHTTDVCDGCAQGHNGMNVV